MYVCNLYQCIVCNLYQCNKGDIRNTHESTCVHEKYLKHKSETKEIGYFQGA